MKRKVEKRKWVGWGGRRSCSNECYNSDDGSCRMDDEGLCPAKYYECATEDWGTKMVYCSECLDDMDVKWCAMCHNPFVGKEAEGAYEDVAPIGRVYNCCTMIDTWPTDEEMASYTGEYKEVVPKIEDEDAEGNKIECEDVESREYHRNVIRVVHQRRQTEEEPFAEAVRRVCEGLSNAAVAKVTRFYDWHPADKPEDVTLSKVIESLDI